jgi:hypothetical protein
MRPLPAIGGREVEAGGVGEWAGEGKEGIGMVAAGRIGEVGSMRLVEKMLSREGMAVTAGE